MTRPVPGSGIVPVATKVATTGVVASAPRWHLGRTPNRSMKLWPEVDMRRSGLNDFDELNEKILLLRFRNGD